MSLTSSVLRTLASLTAVVTLSLPATALCAPEDMMDIEGEADGRLFSIDTSSQEPVIEYHMKIDMLPESGQTPVVQVFADGRVKVHRPVYMKDAGDYEDRLTRDQLKDLIRSLGRRGMMDFDAASYRSKRRQAAEARFRNAGIYTVISDSVTTTIDIRLDAYRARRNAAVARDFRRVIKVKDIDHDARQLPDATSVQDVATSVTRIRTLMQDTIKRGWRSDVR